MDTSPLFVCTWGQIYDEADVLKARIQLLNKTNMVSFKGDMIFFVPPFVQAKMLWEARLELHAGVVTLLPVCAFAAV